MGRQQADGERPGVDVVIAYVPPPASTSLTTIHLLYKEKTMIDATEVVRREILMVINAEPGSRLSMPANTMEA